MIVQRADLHMHTTFSDGALSPNELIQRAKQAGLGIISITDHDNIAGVMDAMEIAEKLEVEVIPGVELSAHLDGREVHILGYFIDVENSSLREFLGLLREERFGRAERIVEKLHSLDVFIRMDKVLEQAGGGSIGRPHIANAIIDAGYAESHQEVFAKYIGYGCPAYVEKFQCSPEEVFSLISQVGGLSFLAHPGNSVPEQTVFRLINVGLDGIETVHPSHSADITNHYKGIVNEYFLLESGGSDFHGGRRNDDAALGQFTIPLTTVDTMRRRLFVQQK